MVDGWDDPMAVQRIVRITRAAPALYEALKAMVEMLETGGGAEGPARKTARALIAEIERGGQ